MAAPPPVIPPVVAADAEVNVVHTNFRLPNFWVEDPTVWFLQVDAKFRCANITRSRTKYEYVMPLLPPRVLTQCRNIIIIFIFFFFWIFAPTGHIDTVFPVRGLYPEPCTRLYEIPILLLRPPATLSWSRLRGCVSAWLVATLPASGSWLIRLSTTRTLETAARRSLWPPCWRCCRRVSGPGSFSRLTFWSASLLRCARLWGLLSSSPAARWRPTAT